MKKILTLVAFLGTMTFAFGQSTGEIKGKMTDEKGEGIIQGAIQILDGNGKTTGRGTVTDFDGNYTIGPLTAGKYNIKYSYIGYSAQIVNGIIVSSDKTTFQSIKLALQVNEKQEVVVISYKKPLIDKGDTKIEQVTTKDDIKNMGALSVENAVGNSAGVTQTDPNKGITINGGREDEVQYIINGHRVIGKPSVPIASIKEISVLTGGISAKYGDATSGIVNITLNDAQQSFGGSIEAKTTQGLDAFGTTQVAASVYGPLVQLKDRASKEAKAKRTVLGITGSFQYNQDKDRDPSSMGVYQVKQGALDAIRDVPILRSATGVFYNKAEYLTFGDLYKTSAKPNNDNKKYTGSAELGIYPLKDISLAIGGNINIDRYHSYVREYALLNSEHNPLYNETDYLIYGRFSQRIGEKKKKEGDKTEEKKTGVKVENANYTVQFDYEKYKKAYGDEFHGDKLFDYGYIGKFQTGSVYNYSGNQTVKYGGHSYTGYVQNPSTTDTGVAFTPSTVNPLGARYTENYYKLLGATQNADGSYTINGPGKVGFAQTVSQIEANGGLRNGQRSNPIYDLWYNVGRQYNGYGIDKNDESYRGKIEAAFDIVKLGSDNASTHKIELGIEYEQRIQRHYDVRPLYLWDIGNNLVNTHLSIDTANPIFHISGHDYTLATLGGTAFFSTDTIKYNTLSNATTQTYFDKHLRMAMGQDPKGTNKIDFYATDPKYLSMGLFTATDILSYTVGGGPIITYYGYDHKGNVLTSQPTTNDFFKGKDADGQYTRLQSAFMPTYAAGYIQDKFFYKDLGFVIGLRIDRYDANQSVLKDPYSLYEIKKVKDVTSLYLADGVTTKQVTHPGNIGADYAVYVTANSGGEIAGYRDGDNWYDKYGKPSTGLKVSLQSSSGLLPYLNLPNVQNLKPSSAASYIKDPNYDPSVSFTKYTPQYLFMPRLQFSFNMTDQAQFFAHFDMLSQRPQNRNQLNLAEYLYFTEYTGAKNNPNLKPVQKTDYEFGFKQQIAQFAAITISAFYQETNHLIDLRRIQYAYPADYTTYDNIDFRSAKGVRLLFDMRRIQQFKINANYTLQFVEGTGSDDQAQQNLINANEPFFRSVYPVSTDARHQIKIGLDYRFESGKGYKGPTVKNHQILADFGINIGVTLRSGTPERQAATVTDEASISGNSGRSRTVSLNARLPWYSRIDLRINKDYTFAVSKKTEAKEARMMGISIYVYIQNLFNTQNVLTQYGYTLNANDDGYLNSPTSVGHILNQTNPQSYRDLYRAKVNNPDNYSLPRRIYLGVNVNF